MAHRVAELMKRAENAPNTESKEVAERECQDLITRLWDMRDNWPSGGPLRDILPTLHQLLDKTPFRVRWAGESDEPGAGGIITKLLKTQREELYRLCQLIKLKAPPQIVEQMQQFLTDNHDSLSDDEIGLITIIAAPTRLPIFSSEVEAEDYIDWEGQPLEENTEEESVDKYSEFIKYIEKNRTSLIKNVSELLQ